MSSIGPKWWLHTTLSAMDLLILYRKYKKDIKMNHSNYII